MSNAVPYYHLRQSLGELDTQHRRRKLVPRVANGALLVEPDGTQLLNFGGNDYLGFVADPIGSPPANTLPGGSQASALVCGWTREHQQLAEVIAAFESTEAAVVFPSGFAACSGTIATLAQKGDLILSDQLNHASLIDGCRLSRADCIVYPHCDVAAVERELNQAMQRRAEQDARTWILTDGVFSMDGNVAPLRELADIADSFDANLIVDEAHGTGVLGETGSGVCEALGVKDRVAIRIGTLSKAIGSQGGFVCGPEVVIDYLLNRCRSLIYSTALAPAAVQAAIDAFDSIRTEPQRRQHVTDLSRRLRQRLSIQVSEIESGIPIVPVMMGADQMAVAASAKLREAGFFVPAIRPPTVPEGTARLRVSLSAAHTTEMVDQLGDVLLTLTD